MSPDFSIANFLDELELSLPASTDQDRKKWAIIIVEQNIDILQLSRLLYGDYKVALRFTWLLSDIGAISPSKLNMALPSLFKLVTQINHLDFTSSFATYWSLVGIPEENEVEAIDLLFGWLQSADTNVTTKSRALKALYGITLKYPELKNELKLCLEVQLNQSTNDFRKRAEKVLAKL